MYAEYEAAVETWREYARESQQVFTVWINPSGQATRKAPGDDVEGLIQDVLESPAVVFYPTGLCIPLRAVNWVWAIGLEYRVGTAEQCDRYVRGAHARVQTVRAEDIHGTCVFETGHDDWCMVQARAFPAWCGV